VPVTCTAAASVYVIIGYTYCRYSVQRKVYELAITTRTVRSTTIFPPASRRPGGGSGRVAPPPAGDGAGGVRRLRVFYSRATCRAIAFSRHFSRRTENIHCVIRVCRVGQKDRATRGCGTPRFSWCGPRSFTVRLLRRTQSGAKRCGREQRELTRRPVRRAGPLDATARRDLC
jgi:hypothetical protein